MEGWLAGWLLLCGLEIDVCFPQDPPLRVDAVGLLPGNERAKRWAREAGVCEWPRVLTRSGSLFLSLSLSRFLPATLLHVVEQGGFSFSTKRTRKGRLRIGRTHEDQAQ